MALLAHLIESPTLMDVDKSGLVTTFSDILHSHRVRMLYSSTFHTANILVEASDVERAKFLLEAK